MSTYSAAMTAPARTLSIRATLTLATGYVYQLTGDDILSYALTEGASGGDMLLGSALSAHGTLSLYSPSGAWKRGGEKLGSRILIGATAEIEIGVLSEGSFLYAPAGSFIVSRVEAPEGEERVTLSGYDALLHCFAPAFRDSLSYPCTLRSILTHIAAQAGRQIDGAPLCNADTVITQKPDWGENCSLRQALAWVCGAMGCFVRLSRAGRIVLVPLKMTSARAFSAADTEETTLEDTVFVFNRLRVTPRGSDGQHAEVALNDIYPFGADNSLTIDDNPLFRAESSELPILMQALCEALNNLAFTPFDLTYCGDPTIEVGDFLSITDLQGNVHPALVFSQQITFMGGLSARLACEMEDSGVYLPRIITSAGKLSSDALTSGIVAARHIAAGSVDAEKISARAITADKIALGAITSDSGVIGSLSADNITAGKLSTDRLIVGGSEFSIVRALNQLKNSLSQNDSSIDGSVLSDKSIGLSKVTDDFGAGLELSSNAAVLVLAGKLDGSHSHMELTEDAINMVGGDINIATNDLQIRGLDDGGEIMSLDPEGLAAKRVVVTERFSAPNVVTSHPDSIAEWKGGVQQSLDALPKYLTQDTTLTIPAGTYAENIVIRGFVGAALTLIFSPDVTLNGTVSILNCSAVTLRANALGDALLHPQSAGDCEISIRSCQNVLLQYLNISGYRSRTASAAGTVNGIAVCASHVQVQDCAIEYTSGCAYYQDRGTFCLQDVIGGCAGSDAASNANLGYSVRAVFGAHGCVYGKVPLSVSGYSADGASLQTVSPDSSGGNTDYVEPEYITKSFAISKHCTYLYGVRRIRDDQAATFSQGRYDALDASTYTNYWRTGAMWFADAAAALAGKSIRRATLTLRRASGGWSNAVPVYLGSVQLAEADFASTLKPVFTAAAQYPVLSLKRETEATIDVTGLISSIQAGQAIGVFEPRSEYAGEFSPAYTQFYGKGSGYEPVLTVEYK